MVLKDKRNHCFFVCNLWPDFKKVKFDVRRTLEPFKDLDGRFDPSLTALTKRSQTLSNALQRYMCFLHFKCGCLGPIMVEKGLLQRYTALLFCTQLCCKSIYAFKWIGEFPLHSMFIHAILLLPEMFTRPRQDTNDSFFVLRPWCNAIRVRTPPGCHLR